MRDQWKLFMSCLSVVCLTCCAQGKDDGAVTVAKRPNILFVLGDDWGWPHASCLGTPGIQTPHFDRLAREGVLFRNAHSAFPSCSPSRAAILTGQWPWRLEQGAILRGDVGAQYPVFPELLEKAGYFIGQQGKGYSPKDKKAPPRNLTGRNYRSITAFIAARPKDKPFCFWLGTWTPHRPYTPGTGITNGLDPAKVRVPPTLPDNDVVRSDICDYFCEAQDMDKTLGEALAELEKAGELENTIVVATGDNGWPFPRGKATCYEAGTHQPLAIRFGAKVKGGRVVEDFVSLTDLAPTFLEAAGLTPPREMTGRSLMPVLLSGKSGQVDPSRDHILTGVERHAWGRTDGPHRFTGYPMRSIFMGDFHYIRNFKPGRWPAGDPPPALLGSGQLAGKEPVVLIDCDDGMTKAWMVTHRDEPQVKPLYELAFGKRPAQELYDLRSDPHEMKNLASDPAYAAKVKELDERLMAELKATDDPRVTGRDEVFDQFDDSPWLPARYRGKGAALVPAASRKP